VQEPSLDGEATPGAWRFLHPHSTLPRIVRVQSDYRDQPTVERAFDAFGRLIAESLIPHGGASEDAVLIRESDWFDVAPPQVRNYAYADESGSPTATVETIRVEDGLGGTWKEVWATPSGYAARLHWRVPASRRVRQTLPVDCGSDASCLAHDGSGEPLAREIHTDALGRSVSIETPSGFSSFHYRSELRVFPLESGQGSYFDATLVKNGKGDLLQRVEDRERLVWLDECKSVVSPTSVLGANDECGSADTVLYTHEASGELSAVYDATGNYWDPNHYLRYHYDTRGRVIRIEDPDLTGPGATLTAYDEAGNVSVTTNARGETRRYLYDAADRLVLMTPSPEDEASVSIGYRPGEWQRGHELSGEYARYHSYDSLGRNVRESLWVRGYVGWWELITDFDPDLLGRIRGTTHPDSTRIRHEYAGAYLERVCELEGAATQCSDTEAVSYVDETRYDPIGRVERVEVPPGDRSFGYDAAHRLETDDFVASVGSYAYSRYYDAYDEVGNLTRVSGWSSPGDVAMEEAFRFDSRNRIAAWDKSTLAGPAPFEYDVLGNLIRHAGRSQAYDDPDRPHAIQRREAAGAVYAYAYDDDGNVVSITGIGPPRHFGFDSANRLVCLGGNPGSCDNEVTYDLDGRRILDVRGTTRSVYIGGDFEYTRNLSAFGSMSSRVEVLGPVGPVAFKLNANPELRGAGAGSVFHLPDGLPEAVLLLVVGVFAVGAARAGARASLGGCPGRAGIAMGLVIAVAVPPVSFAGARGASVMRRWELADPLGTGLVIIDGSGERVRHSSFEPFGRLHREAGVRAHRRHFAGHLFDPDKGLYDMKARWYDPDSGRFLSMDPLVANAADPQSLNAYSYARNNPVSFVDPSGRSHEPVEGATDIEDEPAEVSTYESGGMTFTVSTTSSAAAGAQWRKGSETGPGGVRLPKPGAGSRESVSVGVSGGPGLGAAVDAGTAGAGGSARNQGPLPSVAELIGAEGAAQIEALGGDDTGDGWVLACTPHGCISTHTDPEVVKALAQQGATAAGVAVVVVGTGTVIAVSGGTGAAAAGRQALAGAAQGFMQGHDLGNGVATAAPRTPPGIARGVGFWVGVGVGLATSKISTHFGK
jgi:RHS repeat-associated protein